MAMVNIPSTCDDPSYRYKMPRLVSKKEGRGNGSKTCIVNMPDVARALKRPPQYTTKWFGSELGAQSTYTDKEGEGVRAIVNGHHDTPIFQTMLDKFIEKYVLCENCHLPEIDMNVKRGTIVGKCKACGWAGDLDNNHKLAAFITKNPPTDGGFGVTNLAEKDVGTKVSKEDRRKQREEKRAKQAEGGDDDEEEDDEEKAKRRAERKEKKEKTGEKKEKKERKSKKEGAEDEDPEEKEKRRAERRAKKEAAGASGEKKEKKERSGERKEKKERSSKKESSSKKEEEEPADSDDSGDGKGEEDGDVAYDGEIVKDVMGVMKAFVEKGKVKPDDFAEEIRMQQIAKLFDHKIRLFVALDALMPSGSMDAKTTVEHKQVLDKVLTTPKIPPADVLWAFDTYLSLNEKCVRSYPMVLKVIYDEDWASEKDILKYYGGEGDGEPGYDAAKKSAEPFLKWLQTAEESDDDEDEDSDEASE